MKFTRTIALAALLAAPFAVSLAGEAGGAPNEAPKAEKAAEGADASSAVGKLGLATELASWGRQAKSPEALLAAAQIMAEIPPELAADYKAESKGEGDAGGTRPDAAAPSMDPTALVTEAQGIAKAKGDKNLQKYVDAVAKAGFTGTRGASGGPKYAVGKASGGYTDVYNVTMRGGELAEVAIAGDGYTDLDLYVYDEYGNFIAKDTGSTDTAYVSWTPRWTGPFKVEVINRGRVYNQYVLITN